MPPNPRTSRRQLPVSPGCPLRLALLSIALAPLACGGGGGSAPPVGPGRAPTPVSGWVEPTGQLELVTTLLAADSFAPSPITPAAPALPGTVSHEVVHTAESALHFLLLESGVGFDPLWSSFVTELAARGSADKDTNGNGTNRDETVARLHSDYEFRTNFKLPSGLGQSFLLPALVPDRMNGRPTSRTDYAALRLPAVPATELHLAPRQLGALILAATRRAGSLLSAGRGDLYGRTGEEGMFGLLLLEKAVAAERTLLAELLFDGRALGGLSDPATYDPKVSPRIFPGLIRYTRSPKTSTLPAELKGLFVGDRGSNLADQAVLLRGFAELAWLASPTQANMHLRRLFEGDPFGTRPGESAAAVSSGGGGAPGGGSTLEVISWEKHIKGLLQSRCSGTGCHLPDKASGFSVASYNDVIAGGSRSTTNPTVVKGKSASSLLWQIVAQAKPPISLRMPLGRSALPKAQIDLIAEWIDTNATEKDPGVKPTPRPGHDGLVVILKNLAAFHLETTSGALADRADLNDRGVLVLADSAGEALRGLAAARRAAPDLSALIDPMMRSHATFVATKLVDATGRIANSYSLETGSRSTNPASLGAASAVVAGLFDAQAFLQLDVIGEAADRAGTYLLAAYLDEIGPRSFPGSDHRHIEPGDAARLLDAFASWYRIVPKNSISQRWVQVWQSVKRSGIVLGEWPVTGETFGDGNADSDGDGVLEVGTDGRPPMFAAAIANVTARAGEGVPARLVHYSRDLLPVFLESCGSCHAGNANKGGFRLDTYADLFAGGDFRQFVKILVPGQPDASFLYQKLVKADPSFGVRMPQGQPPLSSTQIAVLRAWIAQGAVKD